MATLAWQITLQQAPPNKPWETIMQYVREGDADMVHRELLKIIKVDVSMTDEDGAPLSSRVFIDCLDNPTA